MWMYGHAVGHSTVQYTQYSCGRMDMQYDTVPYNTHNIHVDVWTCNTTLLTIQYTQYTCGRMDVQYDTVPYNTHNIHVDVWTCSTTQYHTIHTICMWTYGRAVRHSTIQYTQYTCTELGNVESKSTNPSPKTNSLLILSTSLVPQRFYCIISVSGILQIIPQSF